MGAVIVVFKDHMDFDERYLPDNADDSIGNSGGMYQSGSGLLQVPFAGGFGSLRP